MIKKEVREDEKEKVTWIVPCSIHGAFYDSLRGKWGYRLRTGERERRVRHI